MFLCVCLLICFYIRFCIRFYIRFYIRFVYAFIYAFAYAFIYAFCICFYICFLSWIMNIGLSKLKPERLLSPSPGQRPGILQMINIAPCKGKILVYESFALTGRKTQRAFYTRGVTRAWR